jgi:hypothetical protein
MRGCNFLQVCTPFYIVLGNVGNNRAALLTVRVYNMREDFFTGQQKAGQQWLIGQQNEEQGN